MNNVKMCLRCNAAIISNLHTDTADYYRHLSVKYCDECREIVKREQTARRVKALRERKREKDKLMKTENDLLRERLQIMERENELLRESVEQLEAKQQKQEPAERKPRSALQIITSCLFSKEA